MCQVFSNIANYDQVRHDLHELIQYEKLLKVGCSFYTKA